MARLYSASFTSQTVANASGDYELFEIDPATDKPIEVYALELVVTSELAEAQEEWIAIQVIRGHATDGTGGASATPRPLRETDQAAGFTVDTLRTAIASTGTPVTLHASGFNVRAGYSWGPVPYEYGWGIAAAAGLLVIRMSTTVADDVTMSGTIYVREDG